MSDVVTYMDMGPLGPQMPLPIPSTPQFLISIPVLPDVASYIEVGTINDPIPVRLASPVPQACIAGPAGLHFHDHRPGEYCYFCACTDCRMFYGVGAPFQCVNPRPVEVRPPPRYSYIGFVNSMRAAAARREELRQDKLRAERELAAVALAPKPEKTPKEQPKKKGLRQTMKRRRQ